MALEQAANNAVTKGKKPMATRSTGVSKSWLLGATILAGIGSAGSVWAQTATPPAADAQESSAVEEIVVTGYRASLASAANLKRNATNFTDSIVAEDIGKFPDLNIAESLQRIPGVQLGRDVTGEGVQISVRGLGPSFTKITLAGAQIAVASDGALDSGSSNREIDLDLFPTELFTKLTVNKTPTASLLEGGIAGTVNLASARPFDRPGQHLNMSLEAGYSDASQKASPRGAVIASKTWDKFGILVGFAGASQKYRTDGYETIGFTTPNLTNPVVGNCTVATCDRRGLNNGAGGGGFKFATTVPANTGFGLTPGAPLDVSQTSGLSFQDLSNTLVPRLPRYAYIDGTRDRFSLMASAEYRPSDTLSFALDTLYSHSKRDFNRLDMNLLVRNATSLVPIGWQRDSNGVLTKGTFANAQMFIEARPVDDKVDFYSFNPSMKWQPNDWFELTGQLNFNRSYFLRDMPSYIFDTAPNSGLSVVFDNTKGGAFPVLTPSRDPNDPNQAWVTDSYRIQRAKRVTRNQGAHFDAKFGNDDANIRVGYAYDDTAREILAFDNSNAAQAAGVAAIPNSAISQYLMPGPSRLLSLANIAPGMASFVQPNYEKLEAAIHTQQLTDSAPFSLTGTSSIPSGFIDERTQGAYVEANGRTEFMEHPVNFNAGVRYFHTDQRISGPISINGVITFQTTKRSYDGFLPSFNASVGLTDKLILRLAGSRTITRANPNLMLPGTAFADVSAQVASQGNPDLKPYYSNNADFGLEYYLGGAGYISVNAFSKDIQGFTQTRQIQAPFSTLGIPVSALSSTQQATGIGPNTIITINTTANVDQNLSIRGEEFIYQQPLDFITSRLPGGLTGFGVTANYTHIEQDSAGSAAMAVGIAPNLYTLGAYYEDHGVSVRVNYTWTEAAVIAIAPQNNVNVANIQGDRGQLDMSASYTPPWMDKAYQFTFNAVNITNKPLTTYSSYESAPFTVYYPGRQFLVGVRAKF
jgi:TonB-dependent receptor